MRAGAGAVLRMGPGRCNCFREPKQNFNAMPSHLPVDVVSV
jgi:hypothetical protein